MNLLEMKQIAKDISYKDWKLDIYNEESPYLQWQFKDNGFWHRGRKWQLSKFMTKSELVQTAFKAALTAEEHETREKFTYFGAAIFGPHFDVEVLVSLCKQFNLDVREG